MSFRNKLVADVIILESRSKEKLAQLIKNVSNTNTVLDLQYAVTWHIFYNNYSAIILVQ